MQGGLGRSNSPLKQLEPGMTADPLDDFRDLLCKLPLARDVEALHFSAPFDSGGELSELALWLERWSGAKPSLARPMIAIFVGSHGLARHGVASASDADARSFLESAADGSGVMPNLCGGSNIGLKVLELALDHPAGDISLEPALDARSCAATMAFGMEAAAGGVDLICLSGVGSGGDVAARALLALTASGSGQDWSEQEALPHVRLRQASVIDAALARQKSKDSLGAMAELGGREIAAIAGAIIAARMERVPVILDGLAALSAALVLNSIEPAIVGHCRLAVRPADEQIARLAQNAGLAWISEMGLAGSAGVDSAFAVQTLRLAVLAARA